MSFKIGFYFACKTCTHLCPLLVLRPLSARPKKGLVVVVILALPAKVMVTNGLGFSQWPFLLLKLLRWQKVAPIGKRLLNKGTRSSLLLNMALVLGKCPRKLWWPFQSALFILNDLMRWSGKKVKNSRNFFFLAFYFLVCSAAFFWLQLEESAAFRPDWNECLSIISSLKKVDD